MTYKEILKMLSDHQDDYVIEYRGKQGAICIFEDEVIAGYDGEELHFKSLEEALNTPFIGGKFLKDIAEEVYISG